MSTERHIKLRDAETKAEELFREIESRGMIRAGITENALNTEIYNLALEKFGIRKYWHKRIVRAGVNTLHPYRENPPDLMIQPGDILFFDFGPVFEDWEADFGRTYVLGNDADKVRLSRDIQDAWYAGKAYFDSNPDVTGAELFRFVLDYAAQKGWGFAQEHCGHLIGNFPHENIHGKDIDNYLHIENHTVLREPDKNGNPRDWILEIHFIDKEKQFGGFFEQLLTVD